MKTRSMIPTHPDHSTIKALAHGFRSVDSTEDPARFAAYLDAVAVQLKEHKRESYNMLELHPGKVILEVGCGTGDDARAMAVQVAPGGRVVGVDNSVRFIAEARARASATQLPVEFIVGDAHATGLATDSFDGARVERTLQHVEQPESVLAEMRRVVRSGGWIVAGEPDWDTLTIAASDHTLTRTITRTVSDRVAHGCIGRHLPALMAAAGLRDLTIQPITLMTQSVAVATDIFQLDAAAEDEKVAGAHQPERINAWISELHQRDAQARFFAALGGFLVSARVS